MIQQSYSSQYSNKAAKNIHQNDPKVQPIIGAFVQLYYFVVGAAALPARLLLRENFGERSISPTSWAVSLFLHIWYIYEYVAVYMFLAIYFGDAFFLTQAAHDPSNFQIILLVIALLFNGFHIYLFEIFVKKSKKHYREIIKRADNPDLEKGSHYRGDVKYYNHLIGQKTKTILGEFVINERILKMVVEPKKIVRAGILLSISSIVLVIIIQLFIQSFWGFLLSAYIFSFSAVGIVIIVSGVCLFFEEFGIHLRIREGAFDLIDGQKDLSLVIEQKKKWVEKQPPEKPNSSTHTAFPIVNIVTNSKN